MELVARDPDYFLSRAAKTALKMIRQARRPPAKSSKTASGAESAKKDAADDAAGSEAEADGKADPAADTETP